MKNQTLKIILLLFTIAFIISCKKDEETASPNSSSAAFSVQFNNSTFKTDTANFDIGTYGIQIYSSKYTYTSTFIIDIDAYNAGTYNFNNEASARFTKKTGPNIFDYTIYEARSGNITISSADTSNSIKGTFNFTAVNISNANDSIVFTNGSFDLAREN